MKNAWLTTALGAAILTGAAAQGVAGPREGMGPHGPWHSFEELDADGDGQIVEAEMLAHMKARFDIADTDGDGKLSRDELSARMETRQAERSARRLDWMFEHRDADGDGALTLEEMRAGRAARMAARIDTDGDGSVSREEFEDLLEKRQHRHGNWGADKSGDEN